MHPRGGVDAPHLEPAWLSLRRGLALSGRRTAHRLRHVGSPFRDLARSLPGLLRPCCQLVLLSLAVPSLGRRVRGAGTSVAVALAQGGDLIFEVGERLETPVDR